MKLSLVLIIYRSNSSIALDSSLFCEKVLKNNNINSIRLESDFSNEQISNFFHNSKLLPQIALVLGGDGTVLKCANALVNYDIQFYIHRFQEFR